MLVKQQRTSLDSELQTLWMMFLSHTGNGQCPQDSRMQRYPRNLVECHVGFGTYNNGLRQFILNMFDTVFPGLFC